MSAAPASARTGAREPMSERAYRDLKRRILENQLPVGEQYMEQEVAELLGMSRTPTREALIRLANEGLVEIRPRHGMRVKPISLRDMREIYEVLTSLEATAAALAARSGLDEGRMDSLREAVTDMDRALAADDLPAWAEADERFHRVLVESSENERLIALVRTFIDQSHRVRMITLRVRPRPTDSNADHRAVIDAIARGDADGARRLHRMHRERSGRMLVALLDAQGLTQL